MATSKGKDLHQVEVPPDAYRTLSALREMGYDSYASIMDLIDNSLDAGAGRVDVTIRDTGKRTIVIDVLDDGTGMDDAGLAEALRLGSKVEYAEKRLGKYGMGLVTASISMARHVWVLTRRDKAQAYEADFDLSAIAKHNKFIIDLKPAASKTALQLGNHGTLVRLSEIDRITDTNVGRFAANLRTRLGRVYRNFLAAGVTITVNRQKVEAFDPLMRAHPATEVVLDTTLDLGDGTKGRLVAVELPELGTDAESKLGIYPDTSGFYVVRNGRELIAAETFGFYKKHHAYSHFRAELSYEGTTTTLHEDVKKATIHPDDRLRDKLQALTEKLIAASGRRGREARPVEVKLSHKAIENMLTERAALLTKGLTATTLAPAREVAAEPVATKAEATPKKRGRPSKADVAKREAAKDSEPAPAPTPAVPFTEADTGEKGRFFAAEVKPSGGMVITYNTRHPLVRLVSESKQRQAGAVLDMVTFALSRAEAELPEGKKLVNRACDYLAALAAPAPGGSDGRR